MSSPSAPDKILAKGHLLPEFFCNTENEILRKVFTLCKENADFFLSYIVDFSKLIVKSRDNDSIKIKGASSLTICSSCH